MRSVRAGIDSGNHALIHPTLSSLNNLARVLHPFQTNKALEDTMAYYGSISRNMHEIVAGTLYYIKETQPGWGQWNNYIKIKATALKENPNSKKHAWFFTLEDGTKVQRSCEGVWGTVEHVDSTDKQQNEVAALRQANTEEYMSHVQPWVDRINGSDRWRGILTVTPTSYVDTHYQTGEVHGKPEDHPILIQTTTAGLKRLCLALLGDELPMWERQT
jgi:hypothetical protein